MLHERDGAAERREAVVQAVDRAGRGAGRRGGEQARHAAVPKRTSLPSMLPPTARRSPAASGCPALSKRMASAGRADPDREHDREQHPALPLVLDQPPEGVGQGERDHQEHEDLEQVGEAVRVLERVRRVGVVGAAAVLAELLDRLLARDRAAGDRLGGALRPSCASVKPWRFWTTPWLDEHERDDERERQQHADRAAREVDPEVADRAPSGGARSPGSARRRRPGPTAAETKFCTASPAIWVRWLIVGSPP